MFNIVNLDTYYGLMSYMSLSMMILTKEVREGGGGKYVGLIFVDIIVDEGTSNGVKDNQVQCLVLVIDTNVKQFHVKIT